MEGAEREAASKVDGRVVGAFDREAIGFPKPPFVDVVNADARSVSVGSGPTPSCGARGRVESVSR
jgi:hypothetical protein